MCTDIEQRCSAISAAVQRRQAELKAECRVLTNGKAQRLVAQRMSLQHALRGMIAGCSFVRNALDRGAMDPACALHARSQLLGDLQRMQTQPRELQPTESARL